MTLWLLVIGIIMAVLSAIFWCLEAMPCVKALRALKKPENSKNPFKIMAESIQYIVGFIRALTQLWPLALDVICTIWLSGSFGFSGMVGGIIGLSISNVISVFLIIISKKEKI